MSGGEKTANVEDYMAELIQAPFIRAPIEVVDGIPVFSQRDNYVDNYTKIASDHVESLDDGNGNPFIDEELWADLEKSTRELVDKYIEDGARVLDIGVGLGRVLGSATHLDRYGIDISHDYLKKASKVGFKVAFSRIEDMPYPDNFFDAIVACDVLEHVIDLHACCLQILRVLRPGGTLIVRVPHKDDLEAYLDDSIPYEFVHVRSFDVASLRILFGKIHKMHFRESTFAGNYLKDSMFNVKLLSENSPARKAAQLADGPDHPLWLLKKITDVSHEEFRAWIYNLRDQKPVLMRELLKEMTVSLEVNVVFTK